MNGILLHLLRHGTPETPGLLMGRTDGVPTPAGIAACVDKTAGLEFNALISSDLHRTAEAAATISEIRELPFTTDPRWRELDFGDWDGLPPSAIDPAASRKFWEDPDRNPPPGGERWSSLIARVATALTDVTASSTLVVTHGGAIRAALAHLCSFEQPQLWAFDLPYAALLSLRVWPADRPGGKPSGQIVGLRT